jgi:hypothetical protein
VNEFYRIFSELRIMSEDDDIGDFGTPPSALAEKLLFKTPLYAPLPIIDSEMKALLVNELAVDGFCPGCEQRRTFHRSSGHISLGEYNNFNVDEHSRMASITIRCTKHKHHALHFFYIIKDGTIQKVGQLPSFADIALDESKNYSKILTGEDAAEFHKAIGLAAHSVGIGSFVYLRRIFERLIQNRFVEFKAAEGWKDEDFLRLRMSERVTFLKDHLPPFLVRNAKIYSILSLGMHELDEKQCLTFFDILKQSTIVILEEDLRNKEEGERQRRLEKEIAKFSPPPKEDKLKR